MSDIQSIIDFWFDGIDEDLAKLSDRSALWWGKAQETDHVIRQRFLQDIENAANGQYDHWKLTAHGRLALIILLDQFTRNVFRETSMMYAYDAIALSNAIEAIDAKQDRALSPFQRVFLYLPFEHAEDSAMQHRSCELFQLLYDEASSDMKDILKGTLDYAHQHKRIIDRFGRFPHRNKILLRDTTPEEEAFLKEPGSSF